MRSRPAFLSLFLPGDRSGGRFVACLLAGGLFLLFSVMPGQAGKKRKQSRLRTFVEKYKQGGVKRRYTYFQRGNRRIKHGFESSYYEDGKIHSRYTFIKGRLQGKFCVWYADGKRKLQGAYANARKQGVWKRWFPDGTEQAEMSYVNGKPDGAFSEYYSNGSLRRDGAYTAGRKNGVFHFWNKKGLKIREVSWKNGRQEGPAVTFYPNGKKRLELEYHNGKPNGRCRFWNEDGKLLADGFFANGKPMSGTCWSPGDLAGDFYIDSYRDGKLVDSVYYAGGKLKNGVFTEWHVTGVKRHEINYRDGRKNGAEIWWYPNGKKLALCYWQNNQLDGVYVQWFENGKKKREITFHKGVKEGVEKAWDRFGQLVAEGENRGGVPWSGKLPVTDPVTGEEYLQKFISGKPDKPLSVASPKTAPPKNIKVTATVRPAAASSSGPPDRIHHSPDREFAPEKPVNINTK